MPTSVERGVYLLIADLAAAGDAAVEVNGRLDSKVLVLTVTGTTAEPGAIISERIAALDGRLSREGDTLRLELPCA